MQPLLLLLLCCGFVTCQNNSVLSPLPKPHTAPAFIQKQVDDKSSWAYFLQHLPEKGGPVVDYKGNIIDDQHKHAALINYDVGTRDLQQCADALMRLRAEYLFGQKRYAEIGYHFTSGHLYTYLDYCSGKRPLPNGNSVRFVKVAPAENNHQSLRRYLDLVYTYAGTISLAKELQPATETDIGVIIITPGSPGHCLIITDEAISPSGEKVYKLVEGYTPAQSIYILRNVAEPTLGYWHRSPKGPLKTASYVFQTYQLKKFE
jgi:hypothetical protein